MGVPATTTGFGGDFDAPSFEDIVLPKIRLMTGLSVAVDAGIAKKGDLLLGTSADDPGAVKLTGVGKDDTPVRMYVLGSRKTAAISTASGPDFASANGRRDPSDPNSWDVYFYDVYVPEFEPGLPVSWMLWRTAGRPAYQSINTLLLRAQARGDADPIAINVSVTEKVGRQSGIKYHACQVTPATPDPDEIESARELQALARQLRRARRHENDAPVESVGEQPSFS